MQETPQGRTITIRPTRKQHEAYQALDDPAVTAVFIGGGAGGGKSWTICESRIIRSYKYPGYKSFIGREELTRLMGSTYLTFQKVLAHHGIADQWRFNGQYHYIENMQTGSRIDFLDLKYLPGDPLYERVGSTEYSDGAIDEVGEVDFLAYDVLKSRVGRHLNHELSIPANLLLGGNPKKNWTYELFYKPWKEKRLPVGIRFIQSLYNDNPYTAEDYGRQLAGITDRVLRERLKDGNWEYADDENQLMTYQSILDMFTNKVDAGDKYLICDVARYGRDRTVISLWDGLRCYRMLSYEKQGLESTAGELKRLAFEEGIPYNRCLVDEDGVGGGLVDIVRGIRGFIANSRPLMDRTTGQPGNFINLKAQCAYALADAVNSRRIACDGLDERTREQLIAELEQVKSKDIDADRKRAVMPKDDVRETLGRSPDLADCFIMRMFFELQPGLGKAASIIHPAPHRFTMPNPPSPNSPTAPRAPWMAGAERREAVINYPRLRR